MRFAFLFILLVIMFSSLNAQSDVKNEKFEMSFIPYLNGGAWLFQGKAHSFKIELASKNVKVLDPPSFVMADDKIIQVMILDLPEMPSKLSTFTISQQKSALSNYLKYEVDYFKKDLKIGMKNLVKEWVIVDSKLWLVWKFEPTNAYTLEPLKDKTVFQIFASTICFNQILDINASLMEGQVISESQGLLNKMMKTLKLNTN